VEEKASTASIGLLYYSRWKNADSARSFLRIYASQIPRKYSGVVRRSNDEESAGGAEEQVYSTNEGDVLLSISGESVFISEGFELPLARRLRDRIAGGQPQGPLQVARAAAHGVPQHELSLGLARTLSSFGMIRAGIAQRYTLEGDPDRAR
jgi:hypothetical protein